MNMQSITIRSASSPSSSDNRSRISLPVAPWEVAKPAEPVKPAPVADLPERSIQINSVLPPKPKTDGRIDLILPEVEGETFEDRVARDWAERREREGRKVPEPKPEVETPQVIGLAASIMALMKDGKPRTIDDVVRWCGSDKQDVTNACAALVRAGKLMNAGRKIGGLNIGIYELPIPRGCNIKRTERCEEQRKQIIAAIESGARTRPEILRRMGNLQDSTLKSIMWRMKQDGIIETIGRSETRAAMYGVVKVQS